MGTNLRHGTRATQRGQHSLHLSTGQAREATLHGLDPAESGALVKALRSQARTAVHIPALLRPQVTARLFNSGLLQPERPTARLGVEGADVFSFALLSLLSKDFCVNVDVRSPKKIETPLHSLLGDEVLGLRPNKALAKAFSGSDLRAHEILCPDLVIVETHGSAHTDAVSRLMAHDQSHLVITHLGDGYVIGPLVIPGKTACAQCVALTQADADEFYAVQSCALGGGAPHSGELAALYAALPHAARLIRAFVEKDERIAAAGEAVAVDFLGRAQVSHFSPHARCGCGAAGIPFAAARNKRPGALDGRIVSRLR